MSVSPTPPIAPPDGVLPRSTCPMGLSVPLTELEGRWWVLHTRARNEKALAADLARLDVRHFVPLVACRRRYAGHVRQVLIPLFPGYVFLCGSPDDRLAALRTNRVAQTLEVADQDRFRLELRQIQRIVESDQPVDLYPRLREGCRCRVTGGSLAGLEGVVLRRKGLWRIFVGVTFLGQSAELEIDPMLLDVLE